MGGYKTMGTIYIIVAIVLMFVGIEIIDIIIKIWTWKGE